MEENEVRESILTQATGVFGTRELAEEWLNRPALALDQQTPSELLQTEEGREAVARLLVRLEHGVYT